MTKLRKDSEQKKIRSDWNDPKPWPLSDHRNKERKSHDQDEESAVSEPQIVRRCAAVHWVVQPVLTERARKESRFPDIFATVARGVHYEKTSLAAVDRRSSCRCC